MKKKKEKRGGAREGAGLKPTYEGELKVLYKRVPKEAHQLCLDAIEKVCAPWLIKK